MNKIVDKIRFLASHQQTRLTLTQLIHGQNNISPTNMILSGQFMQKELPIRLAKRITELQDSPSPLKNVIQNVIDLYQESMFRIYELPDIKNYDESIELVNILTEIKSKHKNVADELSTGLIDIREQLKHNEIKDVDTYFDKFYNSRIGVRILLGQYIALHERNRGIIEPCNPYEIISDVIEDLSTMSFDTYGEKPIINIHGDKDHKFYYVPGFVYYIFFEIIKNSVKATYDKKNMLDDPINVYISKGTDDIVVKVTDTGGGFNKDLVPQLFSYSYSSTPVSQVKYMLESGRPVMGGMGHGLPLSRLYSRYFGGDIQLITFNGIGTDAIIYLNKIMDNSEKVIE